MKHNKSMLRATPVSSTHDEEDACKQSVLCYRVSPCYYYYYFHVLHSFEVDDSNKLYLCVGLVRFLDITLQYNTTRYNTIQYNTIQCNAIQRNTIQYNTSLLSLSRNVFTLLTSL